MTERNSTPIGFVSWCDLGTPDFDAAAKFYGELLGWTVERGAEEFGGYAVATRNGKNVAGVMPLMEEGQPSAWSIYFAVEDSDTTAKQVVEAGGTTIVEPMDVATLGRMYVGVDPTGAVFGTWQARDHTGFQLIDEPGAPCWWELGTRDHTKANEFYAQVFPWTYQDIGDGTFDYTVINIGEEQVGGTMTMPDQIPADVPPNWLTYFSVDDADAAVAYITKNGGGVKMGPNDSPYGRMAVVHDPWDAHFAVIKRPTA